MNTLRMGPEKDYTANRLKSGMLQLAERTSLVIDESALQPGQLEASGRFYVYLVSITTWAAGS